MIGVAITYAGMAVFNLALVRQPEYQHIEMSDTDVLVAGSRYPLLSSGSVENVIFFNIAGMGHAQLLLTRYRYAGKFGRLNIEMMPVSGVVSNAPLGDDMIAGPHAAAAALATGKNAFPGNISPPGDGHTPTILQRFAEAGYSTGIVTNSYITGATTAAFGSNVMRRSEQTAIAEQMILGQIDILIGGGNAFYASDFGDSDDIRGTDFATMHAYTIVTTLEEFSSTDSSLILGLFDDLYASRYALGVNFNAENPTPRQLTSVAIDNLHARDRGFFLLVDDEGTDFGGYSNRGDYLTQHLRRMDEAVGTALKFAASNSNTLVIVTSESEAGGLVITGGNSTDGKVEFTWGSDRHTGEPVPIFAFGPGAEEFSGVLANTEIPKTILRLADLTSR